MRSVGDEGELTLFFSTQTRSGKRTSEGRRAGEKDKNASLPKSKNSMSTEKKKEKEG